MIYNIYTYDSLYIFPFVVNTYKESSIPWFHWCWLFVIHHTEQVINNVFRTIIRNSSTPTYSYLYFLKYMHVRVCVRVRHTIILYCFFLFITEREKNLGNNLPVPIPSAPLTNTMGITGIYLKTRRVNKYINLYLIII